MTGLESLDHPETVSVVVCAYTMARWTDLLEAVDALGRQTRSPDEVVVVVDHNDELVDRLRWALPDDTLVSASAGPPGLSGARNHGVRLSRGDVVAFLDDDAVPRRDWLERLTAVFADPDALAVGGAAVPVWDTERPGWWPPEFDWVVGCSYAGLPATRSEVRNVLGAGMAIRRAVFDAGESFSTAVGRLGAGGAGCEETELCIRMRQRWPESRIVYEPRAVVDHKVPAARRRAGYFFARCRAEGRSKAVVRSLVGHEQALSSERQYVRRTLPDALVRDVRESVRGHQLRGLARAATIVAGTAATGAGYLQGRAGGRLRTATPVTDRPASGTTPPDGFQPLMLVEVEVDGDGARITSRPTSTGTRYQRARVLVRRAGRPVALTDVELRNGALPPSTLERIRAEHGAAATAQSAEPTAPADNRPAVTVVVATHDRPEDLRRCLDSILANRYQPLEVLVVDSAPADDSAARLVAGDFPTVRYVKEELPGLGRAHNRALAHVRTEVVAFTDDDVEVDRRWVSSISRPFHEDASVGCVTGLICPAELDTPAQLDIESHGRFGKGFERRTYDLGSHRPADRLFPYTAGRLGSGANMAFRTDVLRRVGGFDDLLGAGAPGRGGDDLASFVAVITAGFGLVYEPAAIVHHKHRRDPEAVVSQAFNYGFGLGAYLASVAVRRPAVLLEFARLSVAGLRHVLTPDGEGTPAARPPANHRALLLLQLRGLGAGPWGYLRAYAQARRTVTPVSSWWGAAA